MSGPGRQIWFIGVTTGQSAINRLFPAWAGVLGVDAQLVGRDLPLDAGPDAYRALADEMLGTPGLLGAVVTSHKVRLLAAARDRFIALQPVAELLAEVNSIAVEPDGLHGAATDALAIRKTLDEMLDPDHFGTTGGDVVCFGTGGSARALALATLAGDTAGGPTRTRRARPGTFHAVARRPESLAEFAAVLRRAGIEEERVVLHLHTCTADNDELLVQVPEGSLVVNATGLGKDAPGSPTSAGVLFPRSGIAWDFNYRGDLEFLASAAAQHASRDIAVHDGWPYFLHGWAEALAPVLGGAIDDATFRRLGQTSSPYRPAARAWERGRREGGSPGEST